MAIRAWKPSKEFAWLDKGNVRQKDPAAPHLCVPAIMEGLRVSEPYAVSIPFETLKTAAPYELGSVPVGRAYAIHGDTAKAKAAYQDFLTLWKDADSDNPILTAAKAEYAKVK